MCCKRCLGSTATQAGRGAAWAFLRYAKDRHALANPGVPDTFIQDLVDSDLTGLANLEQAIGGADPIDWLQDGLVALYVDDLVPGVAAAHTFPTWNLRSIYGQLGGYLLRVQPLAADSTQQVTLEAGGSAWYGLLDLAEGAETTLNFTPDAALDSENKRYSILRSR